TLPIALTALTLRECRDQKMGDLLDGASQLSLTLDSRVYSLTAIKKAAYRFVDRFAANISVENDNVVCLLTFTAASLSERQRSAIVGDFMQEVLDQDLREQIRTETEPVRNLILAYAFSKTGIEPDE